MSTITSMGIGSGLDTNKLVQDLIAAEREPATQRLDLKQAEYESELSAYGSLKAALDQFSSSLGGLTDLSSLTAPGASSSDPELFTATADESAASGQYDVEVEQLAEAHKVISAGFASDDTAVGTGTLDIGVGSDHFSVAVDSDNNTLAGIRDAINGASDNPGVTASILHVDDGAGGTESKLVLNADEVGSANAISVSVSDDDGNNTDASGLSQLASGNLTEVKPAQDAKVIVDGQTATRSSNSIDDVIDGVTLDLKDAAPGTTETLTLSSDTAGASKAIHGFVKGYNTLMATVKQLSKYDAETGEGGVLLGDSTTRGLESQLRQGLTNPVADGGFESLAEIGITTNRDGTLGIDETTLDNALANDFDDVAKLFAGDDGVANRMETTADAYLKNDGILENRTEGIESSLASIEEQREDLERRLQTLEQRYTAQFTAMDQAVARYQSTEEYLDGALANLPGTSSSDG